MGPGGAPYVTASQLAQYLPAATLNLATLTQQNQACLDATEEADSYLRGRGALPLLAWGNDITMRTAHIAIYRLMSGPIGWAPQAGSDDNFETNYFRAVGGTTKNGITFQGWFRDVQLQNIQPDVTWSSTPNTDPGHSVPQVFTSQQRGWNQRYGLPRTS